MGTELEKKGKSKIISVLDLVNGMSPNPPHIKHSTASAFYACCKEWNAARQTNKQTKTKRTKQNCKYSETEAFRNQNRVTRILLPLHVNTVGIRDVNMRNRREKNKQPVLLKTLLPSLPMPWYRSPMRRPTDAVDTKRRWVKIRSLKMDCAALLNNTRNCRQKKIKN